MSVPGAPTVIARIQIGPKKVARYAADFLDLQDALGWRHSASEPIRDAALRTQPEAPRQSTLTPDGFAGRQKRLLGHILLGHAPINADCAIDVNANCGNPVRHIAGVPRVPQSEGSPFWQRLAEALRDAGLSSSQIAVAKIVGMDGNGVTGRWFRGETLPTAPQLIALAERAKVTIDWLLTGSLPRRRYPPGTSTYSLLTAWNGLDDDGQKHVMDDALAQLTVHPRLLSSEPKKRASR